MLFFLIQVNGNHETMNVEGDFRYVELGAFDECIDFLEYMNDHGGTWEEAFVDWIGISERLKEDRKIYQNPWGPFNLVKVLKFLVSSIMLWAGLASHELFYAQGPSGGLRPGWYKQPMIQIRC